MRCMDGIVAEGRVWEMSSRPKHGGSGRGTRLSRGLGRRLRGWLGGGFDDLVERGGDAFDLRFGTLEETFFFSLAELGDVTIDGFGPALRADAGGHGGQVDLGLLD